MTRTRLSARTLNALGIPARWLSLRQGDYHVDMGRCHVVCEAWIDDFCSWVILDGQNGGFTTFGRVDNQTLVLPRERLAREAPGYEAMLGRRMMYTCAYFKDTDSLDAAQEA